MFLNWRKLIVFGLLRAQGSPIIDELKFIRSIERKSPEEIREIQNNRLSGLLRHAWENTEYYREVLNDCGVVRDGTVNLDRFEDIPFLTKSIISNERSRLKANILPNGRKSYVNRTGGSTGEPIEYWQDTYYYASNVTDKIYHFDMLGKELGEPEMKIWGSERDIFTDSSGLKAKLTNFLYNRSIIACRSLAEKDIRLIIEYINRKKPKIIWAYVDGANTVAEYINHNGLKVHSPVAIFCGGGTLSPYMDESINNAFHAPAINFYGSREMGDVACECVEKVGLHVTSHSHRVEVVDNNDNPVLEKDGDIIITSLTNYAMPFIRYRIGDRGRLTAKQCPCGRGFPLLESVAGRSMESFITVKGELVSPIYLITMIGTSFGSGLVNKFQIVQDDYNHITLKIIINSSASHSELQENINTISEKLRAVMGDECVVSKELVNDIPPTKSGKYLYTVCNINNDGYSSQRC